MPTYKSQREQIRHKASVLGGALSSVLSGGDRSHVRSRWGDVSVLGATPFIIPPREQRIMLRILETSVCIIVIAAPFRPLLLRFRISSDVISISPGYISAGDLVRSTYWLIVPERGRHRANLARPEN